MTRHAEVYDAAGEQPEPRDDAEREFVCGHCAARCTLGTDGRTEYGHQAGCALSDDWRRAPLRPADQRHHYQDRDDIPTDGPEPHATEWGVEA